MIRDNLSCKVSLGSLSVTGYEITFGGENKNKPFFNKPKLKGRGYIDVGTGTPRELYSPFVPREYSFEEYFKNMKPMPYVDVSQGFSVPFEVEDKGLKIVEKENKMKRTKKGQDYYERQIKNNL
jgi:hypothetical protein